MSFRYHDRRRAPLIKRLAAAALLVLFLGLLAGDRQLADHNQRLLRAVQARQEQQLEQLVEILTDLRVKVDAGGDVTPADIDRIIAEVRALQARLGGSRPAPPVSTTVTSGPATTTSTRPSTTTTTTRPPTTTTTRCLVQLNGRCIA
jgi:hypothetical protein